jgi:DNA-binding response OmpR family regulator
MRVLVAEDERRLADAIARGLRREGMAVDLAADGADALVKSRVVRYDVLVLDRDLPELHGDDVCRLVRAERPETAIIMLTAAGELEDLVEGLSLGADDYLTKPFDFSELVARVRALARRASPPVPPQLTSGDLVVDPGRATAIRGGRRLELSPKEFAVLEYLLAAGGRAISSEELLMKVWDEAANPFTATVKTTVGRLRRKLGEPPLIETVREGGYRI